MVINFRDKQGLWVVFTRRLCCCCYSATLLGLIHWFFCRFFARPADIIGVTGSAHKCFFLVGQCRICHSGQLARSGRVAGHKRSAQEHAGSSRARILVLPPVFFFFWIRNSPRTRGCPATQKNIFFYSNTTLPFSFLVLNFFLNSGWPFLFSLFSSFSILCCSLLFIWLSFDRPFLRIHFLKGP